MSVTSRFSVSGTAEPKTPRIRVGVYGASGTTGTEMIRLLLGHPRTAVAFATSREFRGQSLQAVDCSAPDVLLSDPDDVNPSQVDVVFVCLPHGAAAERVASCVRAGVRVIDLSGDYRLRDAEEHADVYGSDRDQPLIDKTVYGLTETARSEIGDTQVLSNPGCYPTCSGLAMWPLAKRDLLGPSVVINALSGVSGAGRQPKHDTHFCAVTDDVRPYLLGHSHRHVAEIEQYLGWWTPISPAVVFNPHVIPIERGMLTTIVLQPAVEDEQELREIYEDEYGFEPFVRVLPSGSHARVRGVTRTNQVQIGLEFIPASGHLVVTSAIDNLVKGAAGQALQNMNLMFGFDEDEGFVVTSGAPLERSAPGREVFACK